MSNQLPEAYVTDDGQSVTAPTYQAAAQCYMVMTSAETGETGPTLIEPGEVFSSADTPNQAWIPLNRAASEGIEAWLASLPVDGQNIPQDIITQAAYQMRPREGEPEIPTGQWWPAVLKLAAAMADKGRRHVPRPVHAANRPGHAALPIMPFAGGLPLGDPSQAPPATEQRLPPSAARATRQQRAKPALSNANMTGTPQSATG